MTDLHIHTTYCDGKNTPEEMVIEAISKKINTLGFSCHSYTSFDESYCIRNDKIESYKEEINSLKEKYKDKITILCGVELDYFSDMDTNGFDYTIGSCHYVKKDGVYIEVDHGKEYLVSSVNKYYDGDYYEFCKDYYNQVSDIVNKHNPLFIGHFDLVTKFNEGNALFDESDDRYRVPAFDALRKLLSQNALFEVNTGAISRGYRTKPYPADYLLKEIAEYGGKVILSSDSHTKENTGFFYNEARLILKEAGFDKVVTFKSGNKTEEILF